MRYVLFFGLVVAAAIVAVSLYSPPMRLMPPPIVLAEGRVHVFTIEDSASVVPEIDLFYATNRVPIGPSESRLYTAVPGRDLHVGTATIRIGEADKGWDAVYDWSTNASRRGRPFLHLQNMNEAGVLTDDPERQPDPVRAWFEDINKALERGPLKNVIVYVHGANTTVERAAGQAAQLRHFTGRNGVVVLFVWPTAENFLRYPKDMVTAFGAAPHLAELIRNLSVNTIAESVDVFTYSAGATVGSDALALLGREGDYARLKLGEVYHAAPDADFRSFVADLRSYASHAEQVTVAVNLGDSALRLSQYINRASRAGRPDMAELDQNAADWLLNAASEHGVEVVRVRPENIPDLSRRSHTFWYDDPWVSSDVLLTLYYHLLPAQRGLTEGKAVSGARYWTFEPDYPGRLSEALTRIEAFEGATGRDGSGK